MTKKLEELIKKYCNQDKAWNYPAGTAAEAMQAAFALGVREMQEKVKEKSDYINDEPPEVVTVADIDAAAEELVGK